MDINEYIREQLRTLGPERVLHDGIKSLVGGSIAAACMNFGMMPQHDPVLDIHYGNRAIELALDEIKRTYKHTHDWK